MTTALTNSFAAALVALASLISGFSSINPNQLKYNVALIFTDDEEQELKSIERVLNAIYPKIEGKGIFGCFVCEPTEMKPLVGQRDIVIGDDKHFIPPGIYCRIQDIQPNSEFKYCIGGIKLNFMISHLPQYNVKKILKSMCSYVRILNEYIEKTQLEQAKDFFVNYLICNVVNGHNHNLLHLNQIKNERNNRSR